MCRTGSLLWRSILRIGWGACKGCCMNEIREFALGGREWAGVEARWKTWVFHVEQSSF